MEAYRAGDAEIVFVVMGSFSTKAQDAVDRLRLIGCPVGLVQVRLLRRFAAKDIRRALADKKGVAVIDQNLSIGKGGILHTELTSVLYGLRKAQPVVASFVAGLDGRDITLEEFSEMAAVTASAAEEGNRSPPRLLYTEQELRQVRGLQAVAFAERLGNEEALQ